MSSEPKAKLVELAIVKRERGLLVWSFIIIGLLLILISLFMPSGHLRDIVHGFGLGLTPAGVVALILSRYAAFFTELLLREAVETTIRDRLQKDMRELDRTVEDGIGIITEKIESGVQKTDLHMKKLSPLFGAASRLGLENVHLTRAQALASFAGFLDAEVKKGVECVPTARVWIVSSSIKGFLNATGEHFDGRRMLEKIARCGCDLRIIMTDPKVADFRAKQEKRAAGEIPQEVRMNIAYLKRIGVKRESIRYYSGTPTVFAVATSDRMLLNPYPYQTEAFRCFCVIVHKTLDPEDDIYHQYLQYHFDEPWQSTTEIPVDEWRDL